MLPRDQTRCDFFRERQKRFHRRNTRLNRRLRPADVLHRKHNRALGWQKPPAAWSGKLVSSRSFGHTGFTGTSILIDPVNDVFVILLSNRVNPTRDNPRIGDVRSRIADAALGTVRVAHGLPITAGAP